MAKEKYEELRKKRLKEGILARERLRRLREKKSEWRELARKRVTIEEAEVEEKRRIEEQLLREKRLEEERRKKARDAIESAKTAVREVEKETEASVYVPEITTKISKMLADADESLRSADYEKAMTLSYDIKELVEKARLEASVRAEERKRAEEEEKREKARNALMSVKTAVEEAEDKTKLSLYVPETTKKINTMLTDADRSFDSADYERAIKFSYEIRELVEKARLEASRKAEEKRKRRKEEAKYFYCVVPCSEEKSFGNIGINKDEVYTIPYRDIAAVVSDSPMKDYELTEDNTRMHEEVARQVMEGHTVVPVEFGTTIKNERILRRLMTKAYNPVRECLKLVDNKVELGVKAVLDKDIVYFNREKGKECISDMLESLKSKAKQFREGDLFSDRLFLNASFLVERDDIDAFSNEVTRLQEKYPMMKVLYSGPWAPYNFVYIKIGAEGLTIAKNKGMGVR